MFSKGREQPGGGKSDAPRLSLVIAPVAVAGTAVTVAAIASLIATRPLSPTSLVGILVLLVAATVSEAFPVPVAGVSAGGVSLAASFIVGAALIYGWESATLLAFACRAAIEIGQRRPFAKLIFNSSVYGLAAAASGGIIGVVRGGPSITVLLLDVAVGSVAFYAVNIALIALVVARATGAGFNDVATRSIRSTAVPFAIMASVSLMLQILWERSLFLSAALVGPLVAVALYQRSTHGALESMRLAKTDPLTGLGNHRAFQETLVTRLEERRSTGEPLALILVDIDDFKGINDRFGHQAGDSVLSGVAGILNAHGNAFRLGGDEFAVMLPLDGPQQGLQVARALVASVSKEVFGVPAGVTVSIGCTAFPDDAAAADELFGAADSALYHAKNAGRDQAQSYDSRLANLAMMRRRSTDFAGLRAARALADAMETADRLRDGKVIDDAAPHSSRVADLAGRLAQRLGMSSGDVELVHLAGRLHDIGKLSVPIEVLTKTQPLDSDDWSVLREHPETGRRMLTSLGVGSVAEWVLHHHERWDGTGYPLGLHGNEIPLPSRIIFAADAFDAMTSERPYHHARPAAAAMAEIRACAGTQFDPGVVDALEAELFGIQDAPAAIAAVA